MSSEEELIADFLPVIRTQASIEIQAIVLEWDGVHKRTQKWQKVCELSKHADEEAIQKSMNKSLNDERFFSVCPECKTQNLKGATVRIDEDGHRVCMSCALSNHGIVF